MSLIEESILNCPMSPAENDAAASTIREYLIQLLSTLWEEKQEFDGKRPFGSSSWKFELFKALGDAGYIHIEYDPEFEWIKEVDTEAGDKFISDAISYLYRGGDQ